MRNEGKLITKNSKKRKVFIALGILIILLSFLIYAYNVNDIFKKIIYSKSELSYGETVFEVYNPIPNLNISKYLGMNFVKSRGVDVNKFDIYINYSRQTQIPIYNNSNLFNSSASREIIGYDTFYSEDFMPIKDYGLISIGYYKIKLVAKWNPHLWEQSVDWIPSLDLSSYSQGSFTPDWAWWNASWIAKKNFTINEYYIDNNITNFTLFVHLNKNNFNMSKILLNGSDIRFTDASETTQLDHEIDTINSTDVFLWVRVPIVSNITNTTIWIYYNNSLAGDGQNKLGLWGEWQNVYHFNGTVDSLGRINLTANGSATSRIISTPLGLGYNITNATGDFFNSTKIRLTNSSTIIYYGLIYRTDATASNQASIISGRNNGDSWHFILMRNSTGSRFEFSFWNPEIAAYSKEQVNLGVFNHLTVMLNLSFNAFKSNLFINGTYENSSVLVAGTPADNANAVNYGRWSNLGAPDVIGIYDDIRIANKSMPQSWIKADYYSVTDQINTFQPEILDIQNPDIQIVYPANYTNSSNNQLNVNYTVSDDISLSSCFYTNDLGLTNTTITCGQNITTATWLEGINNISVYARDYSGNINVSHITFTIDTISPSVVIYSPLSQNYNYNTSINLNFSIVHAPTVISACWYNIINATGGGIVISNTSLLIVSGVCQNSSFNLTSLDNNYNLTLYANDSVNNVGSAMVHFGIKTSAPSIVINSPLDNQYFSNGSNIHFNFTAVKDIGIDTCELWGNWTGSFSKNYTWFAPTNNTMNYTVLNISEGRFILNIKCNDTANNIGWALTNFTFNVDVTLPNVSIDSITTTTGSLIVSFNSTETDNFEMSKCWYSVFNAVGLIDGSLNNISYNCNSGIHSFIVSNYGNYNLTIYGNDTSDNENSNTSLFTVSSNVIPPGGGGGPAPAVVLTKTFCGDNICQKPNEYGLIEDFYNCPNDCPSSFDLDEFIFSLTKYCWDKNPQTSCFWESIFQGQGLFSISNPGVNITTNMTTFSGKVNVDTLVVNCIKGKNDCFFETGAGAIVLFIIIALIATFFMLKPFKVGNKKYNVPKYVVYKVKNKKRRK